MSTVSQRFNSFLSDLQLSSTQIDDIKTKYNGVCEKLHNEYYDNSYNGSTKVLIGSYGKNTAIAPISDVDVLFKMPYEEYQRYNTYLWNGQSKLLQDIKEILKTRYPLTYMKGDGQVVIVDFFSVKVEVIPAFLLTNGNYYIPNTHSGGYWQQMNPDFEKDYLVASNNRSNGNTIKLIKMLKAWKRHCNVSIKSFAIEIRVVQFLENYSYYNQTSLYYDWMVRDFLLELISNPEKICQVPGLGVFDWVLYGTEWLSKAKSAYDRAVKACNYESENKYLFAILEWKKIFGANFKF